MGSFSDTNFFLASSTSRSLFSFCSFPNSITWSLRPFSKRSLAVRKMFFSFLGESTGAGSKTSSRSSKTSVFSFPLSIMRRFKGPSESPMGSATTSAFRGRLARLIFGCSERGMMGMFLCRMTDFLRLYLVES